MTTETVAAPLKLSPRLQALWEDTRRRGHDPERCSRAVPNVTQGFFELYAGLPLRERQARALVYALLEEPRYLWPGERIAGQIYMACPGSGNAFAGGDPEDERWAEHAHALVADRQAHEQMPEYWVLPEHGVTTAGGGQGHSSWDAAWLLEIGAEGLAARYAEAEAQATEEQGRAFYQAARICLEGMMEWAERYGELCEERAEAESDPEWAAELREMARCCRKCPRYPAESFREAVQGFWLQYLAVMFENPHGGNGPGRADQTLWPYLEADLAAGRLTLDEAGELVTELFIKLDERIAPAHGWVEAIPVGGTKPDGTGAVNPVSHLMIEAIMSLDQTHPSLYMRLAQDSPQEWWDLAMRYLIRGENRAQLLNDDAIIPALVHDGMAREDARDYTTGGCMECGPQAKICDFLFTGCFNVVKALEYVVTGGWDLMTGKRVVELERDLTGYGSFEELWAAYEAELRRELDLELRRMDLCLLATQEHRPMLLMSSMVHDCLERGRALNEGGARYGHYGMGAAGIPNAGDSLYALQRALWEDRACTAQELLAALRADFAGQERLRQYLWGLPRYGQDDPAPDAMVDRALLAFSGGLKAHVNPLGFRARPVLLSFVWTVTQGAQTGATADGRRAGEPFAQSLTPQSSSMTQGTTAALNSATRLTLEEVSGAGSTMWDVDPQWARPEWLEPVVRAFFRQGGHIFQGNTLDPERLREAQEHPERYPGLIVRVSGFSAKFADVARDLQDEIIARYRHGE